METNNLNLNHHHHLHQIQPQIHLVPYIKEPEQVMEVAASLKTVESTTNQLDETESKLQVHKKVD